MLLESLLSALLFAGKLLLYLVLFTTCISFFGITTGIRRAYVQCLLALFEWEARHSSGTVEKEAQSADVSLEADNTGQNQPEATNDSTASQNQRIITREWTVSLEKKLYGRNAAVEQQLERNIQRLAESGDQEEDAQNKVHDDATGRTLKVIANDSLEAISAGIEAIIEDRVTQRFEAAQLAAWNFLSRSRLPNTTIGLRSMCIWFLGALVRYLLLFPLRFCLFLFQIVLLLCGTTLIGLVPNARIRSRLYRAMMLMCMRISARTFSAIVTFHDTENRPRHGVCVANHTSPIDVMVLSTDNCYAMVGQRQGGVLGLLQRALSRAEHHIWFERTESRDRQSVSAILKEHVDDETKMPILIFPEGTCINNTSVMLFKKGSFEIASTVCPVVMKYDNRLGDAFWDSHRQGYLAYLLRMMTAWALICQVWYLPPMQRQEGESSIEFARRCQHAIAQKGGLVDMGWDGNLKRAKVPQREKDQLKELFARYLNRTAPVCECTKATINGSEDISQEVVNIECWWPNKIPSTCQRKASRIQKRW